MKELFRNPYSNDPICAVLSQKTVELELCSPKNTIIRKKSWLEVANVDIKMAEFNVFLFEYKVHFPLTMY